MNRVFVTIHGTGRTPHDFWIPQLQVIGEHLDAPPHHHPVWWGDMIDAGAHMPRAGEWLIERLHTISGFLTGHPAKHTPHIVSSSADLLHRVTNATAGVWAYFLSPWRRAEIRDRLRQTLIDLTQRGHEIVLVSESLGALIAFDVLHADAHRFNIAAWITLGSPLRTMVRTRQRRRDLGAINPQTVPQWFNLYAPRDLVAAPIAAVFPAYPVRDERLDGARGRLEAHHYWTDPRVGAMIARVLRG